MLWLRKSNKEDYGSGSGEEGSADSGDDGMRDEGIQRNLEGLRSCPFEIGDLQVKNLGNSCLFSTASTLKSLTHEINIESVCCSLCVARFLKAISNV